MNSMSLRRRAQLPVAAVLTVLTAIGALLVALLAPAQSAQGAQAPAAPSKLTAKMDSGGWSLSWTDNSRNETGFIIHYTIWSESTPKGWETVHGLPAKNGAGSTVTYGWGDLAPGQPPHPPALDKYIRGDFEVAAYIQYTDKKGRTHYVDSKWVTKRVKATPRPTPTELSPPWNVKVTLTSGHAILTWDATPSANAVLLQTWEQHQQLTDQGQPSGSEAWIMVPKTDRSYTVPLDDPATRTVCFGVRFGANNDNPDDFSQWGTPADNQHGEWALPSPPSHTLYNQSPDQAHAVCARP